ncbi:multi-sensor signal transduction histidine kinase [Prosthecochloris aestuarii DSM 271]|uniref:histidine kinase n=1 Tax=Prosthecochloris aestuarii (strain DSM 271 / SK 413) TaxID=290512 RepID=B4S8R4_PROA2|nr:PAS domain S-box protein [Prosthecochloris aestuarii]ACF46451.1 multi-sensor signal transduction histidine kinase [Prosthecochloris aestuarii DSM 271]
MSLSNQKTTVLIADDSATMRTLISHVVHKLGYDTLTASDGNEAIDRLSNRPCDALLLDLNMPVKSGMDVLDFVVRNNYQLPVIIVSGSSDIEQAVECIKLGAYEYLTKPIDNNRLEITLNNALSEFSLKQQVRLLNEAMDQSPVSIVITDFNGLIEYVNPFFCRVTGYSSEDVLHQKVSILKSGEHSQDFYRILWETISGGKVWQGEICNKKKDGELFWENIIISPVRNNVHSISHFLAIKEDVTEKIRDKEALATSERRFRELSDLLPQPVFETDGSNTVTYFNRAGYTVFGYKGKDLDRGLNVFQLFSPQERGTIEENIRKRIKGEKSADYEYRALKKDGSSFPVLVYCAPIMTQAGFQGIRGIVLDITHRKQYERKIKENEANYRNLFQVIPDPIIVADFKSGNIVHWNRKALSFFGYSKKELAALSVEMLFSRTVDDKREMTGFAGTMSTASVEAQIRTKDGFTIEVLVSSVLFDFSKHKRLLVVFRDITEQKKSERLIKENIRLKNDFIANVSHELRSPLFSILGFSSTLLKERKELDFETTGEFLGIIHDESKRLSSLIEDVLNVSRIDSGKVAYKKKIIDPAPVVIGACESLKMMASEKSVEFSIHVEPETMQVNADPDALKQVVINLAVNAIKFTPRDGCVRVSLSNDAHWMVLTVKDSGVGIPESDYDKIFEKFYRVERPGEEIEGTGLGLPIVKEIIAAHKGSIEVNSKKDFGSTFFVRLPLSTSGN